MDRIKNQDRTFLKLVGGLSNTWRNLIWLSLDLSCYVMGGFFAYVVLIRIIHPSIDIFIFDIIFSFLLFVFLGIVTKVRENMNRYLSLANLLQLGGLSILCKIMISGVIYIANHWHSVRYLLLSSIMTMMGVVGIRILWQQIFVVGSREKVANSGKRKVVVLGAGVGGSYFIDLYSRNPADLQVVGILDRDKSKWKQRLSGIEVLGDRTLLPELAQEGVKEVIIAIPSLSPAEYLELLTLCNSLGLEVYKMPKIEELVQGVSRTNQALPKINISDLLGRDEVVLDEHVLYQEIEGNVILVTGAGGSIGSEIVRQVSRFNPKKVLLLGHGENSIYNIYHEMLKQRDIVHYVPIIADIQDKDRLVQIMQTEKPDIVYHAAAHKHVPLMELNPGEAYKNNIIGTYNVASAVNETGVKKMVMISTDKAVNPPNVMGASKRVAELIVTGIAACSQSVFCAVRFGNVLGSRGSVIPVFEKQIAEGGPVTVTDFRMTRYFMTIPEASKLVLHASASAKSGEVFVLDMGEPIKIVDLAKKMVLLSGKRLEDIEIIQTGIRPGEKLYEELLLNEEQGDTKLQEKIFVGNVMVKPLEIVEEFVQNLEGLDDKQLHDRIIEFANSHD